MFISDTHFFIFWSEGFTVGWLRNISQAKYLFYKIKTLPSFGRIRVKTCLVRVVPLGNDSVDTARAEKSYNLIMNAYVLYRSLGLRLPVYR